ALAGEETGRGRRYQRPPREPPRPPPAPRRSRPRLPGDFAFSTRIVRPSRFVPFKRLMACSASSGVAISTNPKPRDRPVSRSVTTLADSTVPAPAKASRRRSVEVENERPPMKSLTAMRRAPFQAGRFTANRRPHPTLRSIHCPKRTRGGSSRGARCWVVASLIEQLRYVGLFLVLFAAGLGLPVPEEIPIVAAGILSHAGVFRWWLALLVILTGALAGDAALYWAGHHWGERLLDWRPVRRVLSRKREARLLKAYRDHGVKILLTARHVMGLRAAAFLTAGIARVPFWKFLVLDAAAAVLGVPVSFGLAYVFADQVYGVLQDVHRIERWLALLAVATVAVWLALGAYRRSRRP